MIEESQSVGGRAAAFVLALGATLLAASVSCGPPPASAEADAAAEEPTPGPGCPFEVPPQSTRCPEVGLQCEFGNADRLVCNIVATCGEAGWVVVPPGEDCASNDPSCPATGFEITRGAECSLHGLRCGYAESTCACEGVPTAGGSDFRFRWTCADPVEPDCEAIRPRLGAFCHRDGQRCTYGSCSGVIRNVVQQCVERRWRDVPDGCSADAGASDGSISDASSVTDTAAGG